MLTRCDASRRGNFTELSPEHVGVRRRWAVARRACDRVGARVPSHKAAQLPSTLLLRMMTTQTKLTAGPGGATDVGDLGPRPDLADVHDGISG